MRTFIKSILFLGIVAFMFTSCEEDEFTEKDAMDQMQNIDVVLNVTDGSSYAEVVEGATVQMVGDSSSTSKTTDSAGSVTFSDVPVGDNLGVYVQKENFTKAVYNISTEPNSYRNKVISKNLKIYSLSGDNMATVKGKLTIETDLTNREREVLAGEEVRVINNGLEDNNSRSFVGTTDEEGNYAIQVPVNADGSDDLQVKFPSLIEKDQALAVETEEGTFMVDAVPAEFTFDNYSASTIADIPSAIAEVDAPVGVGSGFALGVEANPVTFSKHSDIEIVKGGSGYSADTLSLSEGVNGLAAEVIVYVDNGTIDDLEYYRYWDSGYVYLDNGALYTSAPTLDLSSLGGSGAVLDIQFEGEYKVFIENYGEGYMDEPIVSAEYKDYDGDVIVKRSDESLNGWNSNELTYSNYGLNDYLNIHDGAIYPSNNAVSGDTLFVTKGLVDVTDLTVAEPSAEQAVISFNTGDISQDGGEITDAKIDVNGSGYDPANPPAITVTSLAGYGSGAELKAEVGTDGSINVINVVNAGEGYVWNVNDYDGDGFDTSNYGENSSISGGANLSNVGPGDVETRNVYYGTGDLQE